MVGACDKEEEFKFVKESGSYDGHQDIKLSSHSKNLTGPCPG